MSCDEAAGCRCGCAPAAWSLADGMRDLDCGEMHARMEGGVCVALPWLAPAPGEEAVRQAIRALADCGHRDVQRAEAARIAPALRSMEFQSEPSLKVRGVRSPVEASCLAGEEGFEDSGCSAEARPEPDRSATPTQGRARAGTPRGTQPPETEGLDYVDPFPCSLGGTIDPGLGQRDALAHGFVGDDRAANRPAWSLLCKYIQSGWRNLVPGAHPFQVSVASPFGPVSSGVPAGLLWPAWGPTFPYATVGGAWDELYEFPSTSNSPWLFGNVAPSGNLLNSGMPWESACGSGPWIRVGRNWFVLRKERADSRYGATDLEAGVLGLAIRSVQVAARNMFGWMADRFGAGDPGLSPQWPQFDVVGDATNQPGVSTLEAWRTEVRGLGATPFHIVLDDMVGSTTPGLGLIQQGNIIRLRRDNVLSYPGQQVAGSPAPEFFRLRDAARLHWGWRTYGSMSISLTTLEEVPEDAYYDAAARVARIAGLIAHESLHLVWRGMFDVPWGTNNPWGCACSGDAADCGPTLGEDPWRRYSFTPGSNVDAQNLNASKHYIHYLLGGLIEGLLVHDVLGSLDSSCWPPGA